MSRVSSTSAGFRCRSRVCTCWGLGWGGRRTGIGLAVYFTPRAGVSGRICAHLWLVKICLFGLLQTRGESVPGLRLRAHQEWRCSWLSGLCRSHKRIPNPVQRPVWTSGSLSQCTAKPGWHSHWLSCTRAKNSGHILKPPSSVIGLVNFIVVE